MNPNIEIIEFFSERTPTMNKNLEPKKEILDEKKVIAFIAHDLKKIFLWQGMLAEMREIFQAMDILNELIKTRCMGYKIEREVDGGESEEFLSLLSN